MLGLVRHHGGACSQFLHGWWCSWPRLLSNGLHTQGVLQHQAAVSTVNFKVSCKKIQEDVPKTYCFHLEVFKDLSRGCEQPTGSGWKSLVPPAGWWLLRVPRSVRAEAQPRTRGDCSKHCINTSEYFCNHSSTRPFTAESWAVLRRGLELFCMAEH